MFRIFLVTLFLVAQSDESSLKDPELMDTVPDLIPESSVKIEFPCEFIIFFLNFLTLSLNLFSSNLNSY